MSRFTSGAALFVLLLSLTWGPTPAEARIPLRGFAGDLRSEADRFVPVDLNGDKKTDLLYFRPGSGFAAAYISHGDGTFRYVPYSEPGKQYNGFAGDVMSTNDKALPLDFNGDGRSDFLWYRPGSGYAAIYMSNGDGTLTHMALSSPGSQSNGFVNDVMDERETAAALDINGDGRSDILVYRPGTGYADLYISKAGAPLHRVHYSSPNDKANGFVDSVTNGRERVLPLDLNGDGKSDFIWYVPGGGVPRAYLSNTSKGEGSVDRIDYSPGDEQPQAFSAI